MERIGKRPGALEPKQITNIIDGFNQVTGI